MAINKKTPKLIDPEGDVFGALSKATDALAEISNTLFSGRVFWNTPTFPSFPNVSTGTVTAAASPQNLSYTSNSLNTGDSNYSISVPNTTTTIGSTFSNVYWDTYGYPRIDIVEDTMLMTRTTLNNQTNEKTVEKISVPAWRVDIFVPAVPKENITIKLDKPAVLRSIMHFPTMTITIAKVEERQKEQGQHFLKESKFSSAFRSLSLPQDADVTKITKASLIDGVLSFKIAKTDDTPQPATESIEVDIK